MAWSYDAGQGFLSAAVCLQREASVFFRGMCLIKREKKTLTPPG